MQFLVYTTGQLICNDTINKIKHSFLPSHLHADTWMLSCLSILYKINILMQGHTFKYNNFKKLKQNVLLSTGEKNSKHLSPNLAVFNYSVKPKN